MFSEWTRELSKNEAGKPKNKGENNEHCCALTTMVLSRKVFDERKVDTSKQKDFDEAKTMSEAKRQACCWLNEADTALAKRTYSTMLAYGGTDCVFVLLRMFQGNRSYHDL